MNGNAELLNFVYQNSQMGVDTLEQLSEIIKEENFRECLRKQYEGYLAFHKEAREKLLQSGHDEKGLSAFEKMRTYLMVNLQTIKDQSTSHIAQMLIEGSSMGVTEAIQKVRKYKDADKENLELMEKLKKFEEKNIESLKKFL